MTVSITANGQKYDGFTGVDIARSLDTAVSDMSLTVAAWSSSKFPPGSPVEVFVDDQKVISGYFSRLKKTTGGRKTSTTLIVRSKTCDIVDCDAEPKTFFSRTPQQIASELAAPHNVEVVALTAFTKIPKVRAPPGEKIFAVIERALRSQYGHITDDTEGRLVLTQVTSDKDDGSKRRLVVGRNVLNIEYDFDWDHRFKTIKMMGQGAGNGNVDTRQVAVATDKNAERNRLLILVGGSQQPGVSASNRVAWERNQRIGKATQIQAEVQGWIDPTGKVWEPNIMASLTDATMGWADVALLVVAIKFKTNNSGQSVTILSLRPWKAYAPPDPIVGVSPRSAFLAKRQREWEKAHPVPYRTEAPFQTPWLSARQMEDFEYRKTLPKTSPKIFLK